MDEGLRPGEVQSMTKVTQLPSGEASAQAQVHLPPRTRLSLNAYTPHSGKGNSELCNPLAAQGDAIMVQNARRCPAAANNLS